MGQGGACEMQWCEKENISGPAHESLSSTFRQKMLEKRAPFLLQTQLLIPGLLAQTHNMKNVKHQATIPYM